MRTQQKTRKAHGRAAAAAAATAIVAATTLAGSPAHASTAQARAFVEGDVLTITGTSAGDRITVDFTPADAVVVDLGDDGTRSFAKGSFASAYVDLRAGADDFRVVSGGLLADVPMTINGGRGEDFLLGGARGDTLIGGQGADFVNGRVGTDVEVLGSGNDVAAWNPGDGNDTVDGGLGRDTLAFNGSDGDELMSLAANGQSAVFLRNLGTIRMDLDRVERLDLATFGGADTVTIDDLTGTDVTTAEVDLAATTGAADTKDDTVLVNGTGGPDTVDVTAFGAAVEVSGLAARTSVSGADLTDVLRASTFAGDDSVTVSDAARTLLEVQVDLGADQS
jgi:hypothetical protein